MILQGTMKPQEAQLYASQANQETVMTATMYFFWNNFKVARMKPLIKYKVDQKGFSLILILIFAVFFIIIATIIWYLFSQTQNQTSQDLQNDKQITDNPIIQSHPKIFVADLEYDPKTKVVTQLSTGTGNADYPYMPTEQPPTSDKRFVYKVEVIDNDTLIQSSWASIPKEIILTQNNTYKFKLTTLYIKGAIVRVSLPNEKYIWTGSIP